MAPSNKPTKLSVPPQGHRSIIEAPGRAAVPQLIGKARYRVFASAKLRI